MSDEATPEPNHVPCARCGDFVDAASALLSSDGEPICARCNDRAELDQGEQRAAAGIFAASSGALGFGFLAIFVNPCLLLSILGVLSGLGTIALVARHPEYRARLGWRLPATLGVAGVGILLALVAPFLAVLLSATR